MSKSNVVTGAPWSTAHTPPTTIKSTSCFDKILRISRKSGIGFATAQPHYGANIVLENLQTLGRRERQHPLNKGKIDTVTTVGRR